MEKRIIFFIGIHSCLILGMLVVGWFGKAIFALLAVYYLVKYICSVNKNK